MNARARTPLPHGPEWDFELLEQYEREIAETAAEFRLDTYPNQIEIISSEQMLDAYASSGLPIGYPHWSYGKSFIQHDQAYRKGYQGLAYEIDLLGKAAVDGRLVDARKHRDVLDSESSVADARELLPCGEEDLSNHRIAAGSFGTRDGRFAHHVAKCAAKWAPMQYRNK